MSIKITNFFFFGFTRWYYLNLEAPLINLLFLKRLGWLLYSQKHWSIGAGATIANARFRDGHLYLGIFGWYNSWCIGFFLFWIMSNYGLLAAICSHALYDFIIFFMCYVHGYLGRRRSYPYVVHRDRYFSTPMTSSSSLKESV